MAGHLPIYTTKEHIDIVSTFKSKVGNIKKANLFEKIKLTDDIFPNIQRLSLDYQMNEDHGKVDDEIIAYNTVDYSWEIHLDKDENINQVYLVS